MTAARGNGTELCTGCTTNSSIPLVHVQAQIQGVPVLDRLIKEESCIRDDSYAIRGGHARLLTFSVAATAARLLLMDSPEFRHFNSKY